ncbi:hypothetical protein Efla_004567 [Eimeria flavescens]
MARLGSKLTHICATSRCLQQACSGPPEAAREQETITLPTIPARTFQPSKVTLKGLATPSTFDVAFVEPKVIAAKERRPSHAPRQVTVERRRRAYEAFDIEQLLIERGIDYRDPNFEATSWLPLGPFDDTTYDERSPQEWMALTKGPDGSFLPLPAKGLRRDANGSGSWFACRVFDYNEGAETFHVQWCDQNAKADLLRIELLFKSEDPLKFAERLKAAHTSRAAAESLIQYNYYVDNMPTSDVPGVDEVQRKRIVEKASSCSKTRSLKQAAVDSLLKEVNTYFARTMNKIAFDIFLERNKDKRLRVDLQLPQSTKQRLPQWYALVHLPAYDFSRTFSFFCSTSLYVKCEVIRAMAGIRAECVDVVQKRIFSTCISKALKLDEFRQLQRASISQVIYFLQEAWANKLHEIIETNLRHVGKGWFNIYEFNKETYEYGKVKRMLILTRLLMRDALRDMAKESINDFEALFRYATPQRIEVHSLRSVHNVYDESETQALYRKLCEGKPDTRNITRMSDIPQPETLVLPHLFKSQQKHIAMPIGLEEASVQASKLGILRLIESHNKYLQELLGLFQPFTNILCLSPDTIVAETVERAGADNVADVFRQVLREYEDKARQIEEDIPKLVLVGVFCVGCESVRHNLKSTITGTSQMLLEALAKCFRDQCLQTLAEFKQITHILKQQPQGIEELTDLREYIDDIPSKLEALALRIRTSLQLFDDLEAFKYKFFVEDHNLRWRLYGSPLEILELSNEVSAALVKDRARFLDEMLLQQSEFSTTITDLDDAVAGFATFAETSKLAEVNDSVVAVGERIELSIQQAKVFNHRERLFGKDVTDYSALTKIQKDFEPFSTLWRTAYQWSVTKESVYVAPFATLNGTELENQVFGGIKALHHVEKILHERGLTTVLAKASEIRAELQDFKPLVPIIVSLRNGGMRERHWNKLFERIGEPSVDASADLTLDALINSNVTDHTDFVLELGELATKESYLERALQTMKDDWGHMIFEFKETYKDTDTYILKGTEEIVALLDEHILTTQGLQFSIYRKPLEKEIDEWAALIMTASETLDEWLKCQKAWLYLQPIFQSPDIAKQLPAETKSRFNTVDNAWRVLMRHTCEDPHVLAACSTPGVVDKLRENNRLLERVQKELHSYLELKRSQFARFYFLSNDELLEILSETTDPLRVQPFLCKVFENMKELEFSPDHVATAMFSAEGERMPFVQPLVTASKSVEIWMQDLEHVMKLSVRESLQIAIRDYASSVRTEWVMKHPGQCVLNGSQVHWTALVEEAIQSGQLKSFLKKQTSQLLDLVALVRKGLNAMQSITIGALIVIDVHAKDIVQRLWKEEVTSVEAFEWIAQLRYYWQEDNCWAQCVQTDFPYGYEYLGNTFRLVLTSLTDMAYMTLMGAQQLNLGGSLVGPAGTGKTETTKDLAKALATQCVVFNCSEMMDFIMIAKFFKGLASSGAWCCFDEFNRINVEVLSVIAQQLVVLFGAKAQLHGYDSTLELDFEDSRIIVKPTFNVFITMNPGYAGRSELPDNLKCLFRPMAMMVPDYSMIAEIMLYSFGFDKARELSTKMTATFKLSSEQLSSQDHYDYGMRAVRSVINAAGVLKRKHSNMDEYRLLLQALRDVNVPKFLSHDLPLFENIISDLFPGVAVPRTNNQLLEGSLRRQAQVLKLQPVAPFMGKVLQLYDTIQVRHGIMLVGPTGGGKTSSYKLLAAGISDLHKEEGFAKVHVDVLNPKAVTLGQLYGCFNESTHEWTDGLAAALIRHAIRDSSDDLHWIMFDGPVDAIWVESMNSVLDDNKKLCLNSGEIIALTSRVTMMFEVEDLSVASPATVSRCGMVYMEPEVLGFYPLVQSWLETLPPAFKHPPKRLITELCTNFFPGCTAILRKQCKEVVGTVNSNLYSSCLRLLECICTRYRPDETDADASRGDALYSRVPAAFLFSLVWSCGMTAVEEGRHVINAWLQERVHQLQLDIGQWSGCSFYDVCYDITSHRWIPWEETVPSFSIQKGAPYENIVVPTLDSIRLTHTCKMLLLNGRHILCPGPTGTGKSAILTELLFLSLPENYEAHLMTFSAHTRVNQMQDLLEATLEKRRRGVFGPPAKKTGIFFIDDLNMPQKEEFGAQPPLELLRQWFDHTGWYDRKTLQFQEVVDIGFVAAMGPPGGGRNEISGRLLRHYCILALDELQRTSVEKIFSTLSQHCFQQFSQDIQVLTGSLVAATIDLFLDVTKTLLPTPNKTHYTFSMREIWKVFQGLAGLSLKAVKSVDEVIRCWVHESCRVFCDRLVDDKDRDWFFEVLEQRAQQVGYHFPDKTGLRFIIFTDFAQQKSDRYYTEVLERSKLKVVIENYLQDYNSSASTPMQLVIFDDACAHVARICRIIRQPFGHGLLLGVRGSGRQSLSRLASFIMETECFQIEAAKGYGIADWREDLKRCFMKSGMEDKSQTFLFCDSQVIANSMLEDINSALGYGDAPNLYKKEDMEEIMKVCKALCKQQGVAPTKGNVVNAYTKRVKANLHFILAMSPLGVEFRSWLRMFPSLTNCCTINWFPEWPAEALVSVARMQMDKSEVVLDNKEQVLDVLQSMHLGTQQVARRYREVLNREMHATPTTFLEMLSALTSIVRTKQVELVTDQQRFEKGLGKLEETAHQVAEMQAQLRNLQPVLRATSEQVEKTMIQIQQDHALADETKRIVAHDEAAASKKAIETQALKDDAQRDLDEALPALEEAVECVKKLKSDHIREVKALTKPPSGVVLTMEAVCIMFGVPPTKKPDPSKAGCKIEDYWESAQHKLLKDPKKLLDDLLKYDKDNIPESIIATISPYIDRTDFDPKAIRKASVACEAICMWVRAMFKYYNVAKTVAPKRVKLQQAEAELSATTENLKRTKARLKEVEDKIERLAADFAQAVDKKEQLTKEIQTCQKKIQRAEPLLLGLADEKQRWGEQARSSKELYSFIAGHALISAGMLTYAGPFTSSYRTELGKAWFEHLRRNELPFSPSCGLEQFLGKSGDPVTIRQWILWGLPNDEQSVQNGIIIARSRRWPLMIDPQGQANQFIKRTGKAADNGFEVLKLSNGSFMRELELCIQLGKWALIEDVSVTLDPALDPVLLQQKTTSGSGYCIRLGDKPVPWSPTFRLFLTTKLPNPKFAVDTFVKTTVINFAITPEAGLEDQMLGFVVTKEAPQLEERKAVLAQSNAEMRLELKGIQEKILHVISQSQGNILDDEILTTTLQASKQTSEEIQAKVEEAETTEREIDAARQCYRKVAIRCSQLFFSIVELACIEPMYQYSQQWFQNLVSLAVNEAAPTSNIEQRVQSLVQQVSYLVYQNVARSLFVRHQLLFAFNLSLRIQANTPVDPGELRFLLTGTVASSITRPNPTSWLTEKQWQAICDLSHLPAFSGLVESFEECESGFRKIFDSLHPHEEPQPGCWSSLNAIQKMCILRIFRMDSLTAAVSNYVSSELGSRFLDPPPFDLAQCYKDSTPQTPLIFILSQGSDPVSELVRFAKEVKMSRRFESISLGQGQGPKAAKLIEEGCSRGGWVLLQNCHLAASWMSELERICEQWNSEDVHRDFRLWLTSMPTPSFPVAILQNGVKMTNEPPKGLKANLLRIYSGMDSRQLNATREPSHYRKLLFSFCFFHAVVQERRRFGPIGWNIQYEFTQDDLIVCQRQLKIFLDANEQIPYKVLHFLGARINYGGRVTDANDKRLMDFILSTYINEKLILEGSSYKFSESGIYYCPDEDELEGFLEYIQDLPSIAQPEVFGLHENANINCAQREAQDLLEGILSMAPRSNSSGPSPTENTVLELATSVQALLPQPYALEEIQEQYPTRYEECMNTVLLQECVRYNNLLAVLQTTMKDLCLAIKGHIAMTYELEKISAALFDNQAFVTGVLQNYARKYSIAVDRLSIAYTVMENVNASLVQQVPADGCLVHGVFLEGCSWDTEKRLLAPSRPKVLFEELPVLWFLPQQDRQQDCTAIYMCPLYKVPSRQGTLSTTGHSTNYITSIELPYVGPSSVPILAGVAAFLALQD